MVPEKVRGCDLTDLVEKKQILARLRAYLKKNGLGCLKRLARGRVTEEMLRGVLADESVLQAELRKERGEEHDPIYM